jgi:hypothetical protein
MRFVKCLILILFSSAVVYTMVFAAEKKKPAESTDSADTGSPAAVDSAGMRLGGEYGKGTEPVFFNDESLVSTPVPTITPVFTIKTPEKQAWEIVRNTKDLLIRCRTDLKRYEKSMRKEFMSNLNEMEKAISMLHTYALLHKRDEVEYVWAQSAGKAERTLAQCEDWADEFNENYRQMQKNQKKTERLLDKKSRLIQQPDQIEKEYSANKEDMFYTKKKIDYFNNLFHEYVAKYNKAVDEKEKLTGKLLQEHYELHKP